MYPDRLRAQDAIPAAFPVPERGKKCSVMLESQEPETGWRRAPDQMFLPNEGTSLAYEINM